MDNASKALAVLGLTGTAFVAGALVQNSIRDREDEMRDMKRSHDKLERKLREQEDNINLLEREKDSLRRQITLLDTKVNEPKL